MKVFNKEVVGIVLAGGRSLRMGQNKALLKYGNQTFLEQSIANLKKIGLEHVYVSGNYNDYNCILDNTPNQGPAVAMVNIINNLPYSKFLFLAVDMPLLNEKVLNHLLLFPDGAFYKGNYLPAFINCKVNVKPETKIKELLKQLKVQEVEIPKEFEKLIVNINTPEQLQQVQ